MLKRSFAAEACHRPRLVIRLLLHRRAVILFAALVLGGLLFAGFAAQAQSTNGQTRILRTPTVSATQIAFAYANNIWTVPRAGGSARRLTSFQGQTSNPHFSPDGKWIAFSGEYAGNFDVYVVPTEGGEPRRLTWHPGGDLVQGWTPDGRSILFSSSRARNQCPCRELTRARFRPTARVSPTA